MQITSVCKSSHIKKTTNQTPYPWQLPIVDGYLLRENHKNNKSDSTFPHMCTSKAIKRTQWIPQYPK
jgi:hypothetical protein